MDEWEFPQMPTAPKITKTAKVDVLVYFLNYRGNPIHPGLPNARPLEHHIK